MRRSLALYNVSDEVHRALRVLAARHGRSAEAEIRDILANAVKPQGCKQLRSLLAGDEAAKLKASMLSSAQIAALSVMKQHTDFNDPAKINRMTAFLAGGSMTELSRARTRRARHAVPI